MSHKSSGLWCDVCTLPILSGDWWNVNINGYNGHACQKCKDRYEAKQKSRDQEDAKIDAHLEKWNEHRKYGE